MLDRPAALNALSTAMLAGLARACDQVAADREVRAVVLTAAGERAFCVGADLKERAAMTDAQLLAQRPVFRAAFGGLLGLPQPVIAAVHGYALGGGCELALSCDVIVADETAVFGLPETTVGLVPAAAAPSSRRAGSARAGPPTWCSPGAGWTRPRPSGSGWRTGGCPRAAAVECALGLARRIAANSPVAVRAAKQAIRLGAGWAWAPRWRSRTPPGGRRRCRPTAARASPRSRPGDRPSGRQYRHLSRNEGPCD